MSTDEYVPSDEEMLSAYVTGRMMRDGLMRTEAEQEFRCGLARARQAEREARRKAEARIGHLEDTARVLVREVIAAEDARDEYRRGKAAAEAQIAEEKHLRMKATAAATKVEARIKAVEDVLAAWHVEPGESGLADDLLRALNT